jgi:hypothetical protein
MPVLVCSSGKETGRERLPQNVHASEKRHSFITAKSERRAVLAGAPSCNLSIENKISGSGYREVPINYKKSLTDAEIALRSSRHGIDATGSCNGRERAKPVLLRKLTVASPVQSQTPIVSAFAPIIPMQQKVIIRSKVRTKLELDGLATGLRLEAVSPAIHWLFLCGF